MQRRRLLQLGLVSAAVLGLAGGGAALWQPGVEGGRLTTSGRALFRAIARAVLDGSLPATSPAQAAALDAHLARLDAAIGALPPATQSELSQLLAVLTLPPGRIALAGLGPDWPDATPAQVAAALQSMRGSTLALRLQAYHALRDLTNAAYYADPTTWALLGYPGPLDL